MSSESDENEKGLLYYLPGLSGVTRDRAEKAGLGHVFDGRRGPGPTVARLDSGPDGKSGSVFTVPGRRGRGGPSTPGALAARARWSAIPDSPAWVGVVDAALPGPRDLARTEQVAGHEVELGDGALWLVPVVRLLDGGSNLPRPITLDGQVWRHGDVRPTYRALWAAALHIWDSLAAAGEGDPITLSEEAATAAAALSLNYRIGPAEVSALGLLDTRSEVEVLKALIDLPALEAIRGKA